MNNEFTNGKVLTAAERADYAREGLVRPDYRLPADVVAHMRLLLERTLDATPGQRPESLVCPHVEGMNGLPKEITDQWLAICTRPGFVDAVSDILGEDVMLWGSQLFCKPSGTGLEVPWHQDGHFWPIEPLATVTMWLAIDDVDAENSAMLYVPGSHRSQSLFPHAEQHSEESALNAQMLPEDIDLDHVAIDELPAGGFSLHDVYLVHGSKPNRSNRRRAGFVIRYMPTTSHYDRETRIVGSHLVNTNFAERPLYLLRGQDRTGKTGVVNVRG
jgi:hypothetical protein